MFRTRLLLVSCLFLWSSTSQAEPPNVLLITIDDLNDWVGCLGGHPQVRTPHIDALARRGVLFTNAHCNGPICNPSRVSFLTGVRPSTSGIYLNSHRFRAPDSAIRDAVTLPQFFTRHGYLTLACGKLFHGSQSQEEFEQYGPAAGQGPLPQQRINVPASVTRSRLWDWGVFPHEDEDDRYNDVADAEWAAERLSSTHDRPFLLACGFYRPHVPWYAPQRFHDLYPISSTSLPDVLANDRADIPQFALRLTANDTPPPHQWFVNSGTWQAAVSSYLACISFVDANVGRVMAALDAGPHAGNTWVVLLSDHGFFLGEKERWAKQSLWERATKVPLIIVPPKNNSARDAGRGTVCDQPAELLSVFPTLVEVCALGDPPPQLEGHSLVPLLKDVNADWSHPAITTHDGDNHAVRGRRYRYIRYADGSEELYDLQEDRAEWNNLAGQPEFQDVIRRLARHVPTKVAEPPATRRRIRRNGDSR